VNIGSLRDRVARRRDDAKLVGATALVSSVLDVVIDELQELENASSSNGNGEAPHPDRMLRAPEVAERLGVAVRTVYTNAGGWPFTRRYPGGSVRFSERGLSRWLERRRL
jgi:predicted DNA-binding transcriptional regulator AlpA